MCAVSAVGDGYRDIFKQPRWDPYVNTTPGSATYVPAVPQVTRQEFEELKSIVLQMKEDLLEARRQDIANNEPDCEMEDKVVLLKQIAKSFGIDLSEVFGKDAG